MNCIIAPTPLVRTSSRTQISFIPAPGWVALVLLAFAVVTPRGAAQVQFSGPTDYPVGAVPGPLAVGDVKGDGHQDLAVINTGSGTVSVLLGNGDGTFQPAATFLIGDLLGPDNVAIGDFNHDGKDDLAVSAKSGVFVMLGNGDGTFSLASNPQNPTHGGYGFWEWSLAVADLNNDRKPDLVGLNIDFGVQPNSSDVEWGIANGDGTFQGPVGNAEPCVQSSGCLPLPYVSYGPNSLAVGDFNGDALPDLAVTNSSENKVSIFLNTLTPPPDFSLAATPANLTMKAGGQASDTVVIAPMNESFGSAIHASGSTCGIAISTRTPFPSASNQIRGAYQ